MIKIKNYINDFRKKNKYFNRYWPHIKFFLVYTLIFIIFKVTFNYTAPLLIGFLFAVLMQPVYSYMRRKLLFKSSFAATVITTVIFVIIIGFFCWVAVTVISEIITFLTTLNNTSLPIYDYIENAIDSISKYIGDGMLRQNVDKLFEFVSSSLETVTFIYTQICNLFYFIPAFFTMLIVAVCSTYYFTHDFNKIKRLFYYELSDNSYQKASKLWVESISIMKKYFRAYFTIYFLTFLETLVVFLALDIKYAIFLSVLMAVSDILPILGPGTVYLPMIAIYLFSGRFYVAIGLTLSWILISAIRQFIEPKIVAKTVKIHPLLVLIALYFSILAGSLWVFAYMMLMFLFYQIFIKVEFLKPIFRIPEEGVKAKT